ncbi:MAG: SDR family oxidoreductase [Candidatus Caenarcaniphilales bacterium]|nr:SDR family oxidoreductase [Candidatus Caenarcaniphilales bacterium]
METALITGASSGIGYELAKIFAKNKINLVLVARNGVKLKNLKKEIEEEAEKKNYQISVSIIVADLSATNSPEKVFNQLQKDDISIDYLVNNAGFGVFGKFQDTDINKEQKMINLNILSLTKLTKLFLPQMLEKKKGKIMNVASTAAFQPGPLMAVYFASKAYVLFFSEALSKELKGTGITVTALCPGPTESKFQEEASMKNSKVMKKKLVSSEKVAKYGYKAMFKGKKVAIQGLRNKMLAFSVRLFPRSLVSSLTYSMMKEA